mgnify:CR=1 FL=1
MINIDIIRQKLKTGLGKDILWTLLGQIAVMLVLLIVNKVLSNNLSIKDFGIYNIIKRSTSVLSFVLLGGMGITIPRYLSVSISKHKISETQLVLRVSWAYLFMVCMITSAIYLLLYSRLTEYVIGDDNLVFYILCLLYAITIAISSYFFAYYRGIGNFKMFNIVQIIFQVLMVVPLLLPMKTLVTIIYEWTILNTIFIVSLSAIEYKKYKNIIKQITFRFSCFKKTFLELTGYSLPRLIGDFFLFAYSAFPVIYVGARLGYEETSYYSIGVSLVTMVTPVFSFLGVILLPHVAKKISNNKVSEANRLVIKLSIVYTVVAIFFTTIMYLGMECMISVFFADKYVAALPIAKIIAISLLPQAIYLLYRNPNDAASVFPYNTIILAISFCVMVVGFMMSSSLMHFAYIYLFTSIIQCVSSVCVWKFIIHKL